MANRVFLHGGIRWSVKSRTHDGNKAGKFLKIVRSCCGKDFEVEENVDESW